MLDKDAIKELFKFNAIGAAAAAVDGTGLNEPLALPDDFKLHDIEQFAALRRRARGTMSTNLVPDFAHYVGANAEVGATVFVDAAKMTALAVLNLGTPDAPGHADNLARYAPQATAAYDALRKVATGQPLSQRTAAEFFEDWGTVVIGCFREDESVPISLPAAIAAVRNITIEGLKKQGNSEQQLCAERSTFEKVAVSDADKMPTLIYFQCVPYIGLQSRMFVLRLGILAGDKAPSIVLRVKAEQHAEEMAEELAGNVRQALQGKAPVVIGTYSRGT